jgi:hypothetical protein
MMSAQYSVVAATRYSANKSRKTEQNQAEIRTIDFPLKQKDLDLKYRGHHSPSLIWLLEHKGHCSLSNIGM